ncbi:MAG: efflux RND transporter periplasmic adaptor subunit [Deltaproteobacteria bacterium]|nr:efflux RND transporter periplasmic adaptor subunit [Deltaproteobacteria bacterium]
MTRPALWIAALAIAGLGGAVWLLSRPTPLPVVLAEAARGRVEATVANTRAGTVEACQRARMSPPAAGQIARLPVREGDRVAGGDLLLELWNEDLRAQLVLAEREVEASRARAVEACTIAEVAERDAQRLVRLRGQGVAAVESTEQAVGQAKARDAGCQAARTSAEVSQARVDAARAAMERTILRAPFAGVVAELNGEIGEFVTPSPLGVATLPTVDLIDTGCLYVRAPLDEVDAGRVRAGLEARITLDAFPGVDHSARVRRVAPYVLDLEKQARTVDVEAEFVGGTGENLLVGYSADVEIVLDTRDGVLRVPTEALLEGYRVLLYDEGSGTLEERTIEPGLQNWEFTEVRSGLEDGDRVVLTVDREGVAAGARVVPESEAKSGAR